MTPGISEMQRLCADSLVSLQNVNYKHPTDYPSPSKCVLVYYLLKISIDDDCFAFIHNLQMQRRSMLVAASLFVELDLSSWIMWAAEGMRQISMIVLTMDLVSTTAITVKMLE